MWSIIITMADLVVDVIADRGAELILATCLKRVAISGIKTLHMCCKNLRC